MAGGNRQLAIDQFGFLMAFERDADYDDMGPDFIYLDRLTGELIWLYETDEDADFLAGLPADENRRDRERVAALAEEWLRQYGITPIWT